MNDRAFDGSLIQPTRRVPRLLGGLAVGLAWAGGVAAQGASFLDPVDGYFIGRLFTSEHELRSAGDEPAPSPGSAGRAPVVQTVPSAGGNVVKTSMQPPGVPNAAGSGTNLSRDGACAVGFQDAGGTTPFHAFRWTQAGGPVDLGTLDPPNNASRGSFARGVSNDCSVVVGISDFMSGSIQHAFRWTAAGGMVDLGVPAGPARQSRAFGVSADGAVLVGDAEFADAASFSGFRNGAFRWSGGSFEALGSLSAGYASIATGVTADGATIVGGAHVATGPTTTGQSAFRWTQATGMVALGSLPGVTHALATMVSDNGRIVAGTTTTLGVALDYRGSLGFDRGDGAFRWTEATGMRDLRQLLVDAGVDLTGVTLLAVTGMSPDGQWITGQATTAASPNEPVAFIAQYCDAAIGAPCAVGGGGGGAPFTLGASNSSLSVAAGSSATTTLTLTPQAGFTGAVSFACSGLPVGAACSFAPASVTPAGAPLTTTLTITTDGGPVAVALLGGVAATALALLPLLVAPGIAARRRWRRHALWAGPLVLLALIVTACGGGSDGNANPPATGTPAGTSTVTVTATSGSGASAVSSTVAITLTVTR